MNGYQKLKARNELHEKFARLISETVNDKNADPAGSIRYIKDLLFSLYYKLDEIN